MQGETVQCTMKNLFLIFFWELFLKTNFIVFYHYKSFFMYYVKNFVSAFVRVVNSDCISECFSVTFAHFFFIINYACFVFYVLYKLYDKVLNINHAAC